MHGNLRYVKSTWIGLVAVLVLASPARAELVTSRADRGVATSPLAADGSFQASGLNSSADELYRAVYVDPATGIPFSFLPGVPVGVSG